MSKQAEWSPVQWARRKLAKFVFGEEIERLATEEAYAKTAELLREERQWVRVNGGTTPLFNVASPAHGLQFESETLSDLADEDRAWDGSRTSTRDISRAHLTTIQTQCQFMYNRHPLARNIINNYVFLTVGGGAQIRFKSKANQRQWDEWARVNNWIKVQKDHIRNTYALGEWVAVSYPLSTRSRFVDDQGRPLKIPRQVNLRDQGPSSRRRGALREHVRGFDPRDIEDIAFEGGDRDRIDGLQLSDGTGKRLQIASEDLVWYRINRSGIGVRGRPVLEPVLRYLRWLHGFIQDRVVFNALRTRMPIIRQLTNISGTSAVETEGAKFSRVPRPGTVVTVGAGEEWKFPELNINAANSNPDLQALLRMIASGVNLPEFLVTSNATTANRASLTEAVDQLRPMFDDFQSSFAADFMDLAERVVGERPESVVWVAPEKRNELNQVKAYLMAVDEKIMSRSTAAQRLNLDWDEEVERLAKENDKLDSLGLVAPPPVIPPPTEEPDDDAGKTPPPPGDEDDEDGEATGPDGAGDEE